MPEPLYRPWGTVTPEFWATPDPGTAPPPAEVTPDVLAARIDRDATAEYGELDLHTIQVREVRGYLAALAGDHPSGLSWYLHAAQLRVTIQGPGHPDVEAATRRALRVDGDPAALLDGRRAPDYPAQAQRALFSVFQPGLEIARDSVRAHDIDPRDRSLAERSLP